MIKKRKYAIVHNNIILFFVTLNSYFFAVMEGDDKAEILKLLYETRNISVNIGHDFEVKMVQDDVTDYLD